jgi:hypothetical protein
MANKAQKTRQKMTFRVEAPKPRNPFALRARQLKGGSHEPTVGSKRQSGKQELRRLLKSRKDES